MIIKGENYAYKIDSDIYHCAMDVTMRYYWWEMENGHTLVSY